MTFAKIHKNLLKIKAYSIASSTLCKNGEQIPWMYFNKWHSLLGIDKIDEDAFVFLFNHSSYSIHPYTWRIMKLAMDNNSALFELKEIVA